MTKLITSKTDGDKEEINASVQNLLTQINRFVAFESKLPTLLQENEECIVKEILQHFNKGERGHPHQPQMQAAKTSDGMTVEECAKELKRMKKKVDHLEGSVYFPKLDEQPFQKKCCGVLCALKPSAKLIAKRSSERKQGKNVKKKMPQQTAYLTIQQAPQVELVRRKIHGGLLTLAQTIACFSLITS